MKLLLVASILALAACSSGGAGSTNLGAGGGGGGGGDMTRLCNAVCGQAVKCDPSEAKCASECPAETAKYQGKWSAAFVNFASSCFETLACDANEETCIANFKAIDPAYPDIPEVQSCLARRSECLAATSDGGITTTFADDYCHTIAILTTSARAEANACLSKACAEIRTCLVTAGAYNY